MKIKLLLSLFFVAAFASVVLSQSVKITQKKTIYRRPKPEADYKKTFTIIYPRVSGLSPTLNKKVQTTISYEGTLGLKLKEELGEFQWLEEASYEVNYNKNGILVITLSMEGSAAYPSTSNKTVVVDLKTGNRVTPAAIFTNPSGLAAMCRKSQKAEIAQSIKDIKKDNADEQDPEQWFADAKFTAKNLGDFSLNDRGITFLYDYGFPHVVLALEPDGSYFFTWHQLKPYLRSGSLLQRVIR